MSGTGILDMSKERVLITGAKGFIGSKTVGGLEKVGAKSRGFEGDVRESADWERNLGIGEIIFLIAGVRTETDVDFAVNSHSVEKLFNAAVRLNKLPRKLILASSAAVYLDNKIPFKEEEEPLPTTVYSLSKLQGERVAQGLCRELEVPLVILRYSTVLGGGVREKSRMSGPLFAWVKAALAGEPIKVFQDGNQSRDYIHVDDIVRANILAISLPSGIYNVGGGKPVRLLELANWIKEAAGSSSEIVIAGGEPSKSDPREMFSDTVKLQSYGWQPQKSARQAVEAFVAAMV